MPTQDLFPKTKPGEPQSTLHPCPDKLTLAGLMRSTQQFLLPFSNVRILSVLPQEGLQQLGIQKLNLQAMSALLMSRRLDQQIQTSLVSTKEACHNQLKHSSMELKEEQVDSHNPEQPKKWIGTRFHTTNEEDPICK